MSMVCSVVDNSWLAVRGPCCKCVSKSWFFTRRTDITDAGKRTETCASIKEPGGQQTAVPFVSIKPSPAQPIPQGVEKQIWLRWLRGVCGDLWMWCVNAAIHLPIACCPAAKHRDEWSVTPSCWIRMERCRCCHPQGSEIPCVLSTRVLQHKNIEISSPELTSPQPLSDRAVVPPSGRTTGCGWDAQRSLRGAVVLFLWGTVLLARLQGAMPAFINLLCCRMLLEGPHVDRRHGRSFLLLSKAVLSTLTQGW